ncbi:MAG: hypothetical protein Q7U04_07735 [Bacteriovorax sp.]|nr:hypothetical protein [Bacteriovorax sp.]
MQSKARKINFKLKEEVEPEEASSNPGILKFHFAEKANQTLSKNKESNKKNVLSLKESDKSKELKKKKYNNINYFGVKNHIDLFEVGRYYTNLQQTGLKSLAFYGNQNTPSVHHSILGIASFFNYHKNLKATVFINKFEGSELAKYLKPTHIEVELINQDTDDDSYEIYACDGVEIVDLSKLKHIAYKIGPDAFTEFLARIVKSSDVVFWELPKASAMDRERELYLPILNIVDSLTLVIDTGISKQNEINEISELAGKYQIPLEGVLLYNRK